MQAPLKKKHLQRSLWCGNGDGWEVLVEVCDEGGEGAHVELVQVVPVHLHLTEPTHQTARSILNRLVMIIRSDEKWL